MEPRTTWEVINYVAFLTLLHLYISLLTNYFIYLQLIINNSAALVLRNDYSLSAKVMTTFAGWGVSRIQGGGSPITVNSVF
jgi:hypothetical protein